MPVKGNLENEVLSRNTINSAESALNVKQRSYDDFESDDDEFAIDTEVAPLKIETTSAESILSHTSPVSKVT
jgi:hypothetical protein